MVNVFFICDSSPSSGGSFRGLRFVTLVGRKLSRSAIRHPRREEAFAVCDSSPSSGGSFRGLRFVALVGRKLSRSAIRRPRREEAFASLEYHEDKYIIYFPQSMQSAAENLTRVTLGGGGWLGRGKSDGDALGRAGGICSRRRGR